MNRLNDDKSTLNFYLLSIFNSDGIFPVVRRQVDTTHFATLTRIDPY